MPTYLYIHMYVYTSRLDGIAGDCPKFFIEIFIFIQNTSRMIRIFNISIFWNVMLYGFILTAHSGVSFSLDTGKEGERESWQQSKQISLPVNVAVKSIECSDSLFRYKLTPRNPLTCFQFKPLTFLFASFSVSTLCTAFCFRSLETIFISFNWYLISF